MSIEVPAAWTVEASRLPITCAQVREDPAIDLDVVRQAGPGARVIMVASGGCTAAALAAYSDAAAITCVDPNPAQIALARLKLALLEDAPAERLRVLGHEPMAPAARADRIAALSQRLGIGNPFLAQMLLGRFAPAHAHSWLQAPAAAPRAAVTWRTATLPDALKDRSTAFDVVHLSNILDWLSPDEARELLGLARGVLSTRGRIIVRQLNSALDIPALGGGFSWDDERGTTLAARDRSFFYRSIFVGRRR